MHVQLWDISRVKPYPNNPRINSSAIDVVANSIREFGFRQPIVVDAQGVIVAGHTRHKAALKLRLGQVPVHVASELTEAQIRAYRIADNKTAEHAEWDFDLLPIELAELQACNFDLGLLGFDADELATIMGAETVEGLTDPDDVPTPPEAPVTRPGDLWILGCHRLLCGDSTNRSDVERLMNGEQADLWVTDPPYNIDYSGKT